MRWQDASPVAPDDRAGVSPSLAALGLTLLTIAAYAALSLAGFVWDDKPLVLRNSLTGDWHNLPQMFMVDLWETAQPSRPSGYFRPLMLVSLALDRFLWGLSPVGHHLHSLGWHLFAAMGLWTLLRRLVEPWPAVAGVALFLLHPLQSEAVAWIAARNDLMVAAFTFWSAALLLEERPSCAALAGGGLAAAGAMFSKESGLLVVGLLLALDLARWGRPRAWRRYAVIAGAIALWLTLRVLAGIPVGATVHPAHWDAILTSLVELMTHCALRLMFPWPLTTGDHMDYLNFTRVEIFLGLGGALVTLAVLVVRGGRLALAGLTFALLSFVPSLVAIAMHGLIGERYLYAPMGGLALAVSAASLGIAPRRFVMLAPFALVAAIIVSQRLPAWASEVDLWEAAYTQRPNPLTASGYGNALAHQRDLGRACPLLMSALNAPRPSLTACTPALRCLMKVGDLSSAARLADEFGPRECRLDHDAQGLRALVYAHVGRWDEARALVSVPNTTVSPDAMLVQAALARLDGDEAAYASVRAAVSDENRDRFDVEVSKLTQVNPAVTYP